MQMIEDLIEHYLDQMFSSIMKNDDKTFNIAASMLLVLDTETYKRVMSDVESDS